MQRNFIFLILGVFLLSLNKETPLITVMPKIVGIDSSTDESIWRENFEYDHFNRLSAIGSTQSEARNYQIEY